MNGRGGWYGHYSAYNRDHLIGQCTAQLALQFWLGLLSERWTRIDRSDFDHPVANGADLKWFSGYSRKRKGNVVLLGFVNSKPAEARLVQRKARLTE